MSSLEMNGINRDDVIDCLEMHDSKMTRICCHVNKLQHLVKSQASYVSWVLASATACVNDT